MSRTFLWCAAGLLFAACAVAQQYKWIDKDGKVRYGDTPPPGAEATLLKPPPAGPASTEAKGTAGKQPPLSPEAAFQKRRQDAKENEEKAAKERADAEKRRAKCP